MKKNRQTAGSKGENNTGGNQRVLRFHLPSPGGSLGEQLFCFFYDTIPQPACYM